MYRLWHTFIDEHPVEFRKGNVTEFHPKFSSVQFINSFYLCGCKKKTRRTIKIVNYDCVANVKGWKTYLNH